MKFPLVVIFYIISFNITMLTLSMQTGFPGDWHVSTPTKVIAWMITIAAWVLSYRNRHKYITLK